MPPTFCWGSVRLAHRGDFEKENGVEKAGRPLYAADLDGDCRRGGERSTGKSVFIRAVHLLHECWHGGLVCLSADKERTADKKAPMIESLKNC